MNRSSYPAFVKSIWTEPGEQTERGLSIAALGLIGECGEVCEVLLQEITPTSEANLVDECGDVLYYATVLADWKGMHIEDVWPVLRTVHVGGRFEAGCTLAMNAKEVSERVKKLIRDGKDPSRSEIRAWLRGTLAALENVLHLADASLHDAMDANVAKLEVRYAHAL